MVGCGRKMTSGDILQAALDQRVADMGSLKEAVPCLRISTPRAEMKSLQRGRRTGEVRHQGTKEKVWKGECVQCRHIILRGLKD